MAELANLGINLFVVAALSASVLASDGAAQEINGTVQEIVGHSGDWEMISFRDEFFDREDRRAVKPKDTDGPFVALTCVPQIEDCLFTAFGLPDAWDLKDLHILARVDAGPVMKFSLITFMAGDDRNALFESMFEGEILRVRVFETREDLENNRNGITMRHSLDGISEASQWAVEIITLPTEE